MDTESPKTGELLAALHRWTQPLLEHPAFRALTRGKIKMAMDWVDDIREPKVGSLEVHLVEPLESQHEAVMQFYYLRAAHERLRQTEFYFRRYPFKAKQLNRYEHLENICTMYFSGFYIFEERIDKYLNALNKVSDQQIDVGVTLKQYRKMFRDELQERHGATHFAPFDDTTIHAVMLRTLMGHGGQDRKSKDDEVAFVYRKASREWARIARARARVVGRFLEAIAAATLESATFLKTLPVLGPDDLTTR